MPLILCLKINAQDTLSHYHHWEDGPLTWEHFQAEPLPESFDGSNLAYHFQYIPTKMKRNDTVIQYYNVFSAIDPAESWVIEEAKQPSTLLYNQIMLNTLEYYERKLERKLNRLGQKYSPYSIFSQMRNAIDHELNRIANETEYGLNEANLQYWKEKSEERLAEGRYDLIANYQESDFGLGVNVGLTHSRLSGLVQQYLSPATGFYFSFDFAYQKWRLVTGGSLGGQRLKQSIPNAPTWDSDTGVSNAIIDFSIQYPLVEANDWKISPVGGFGIYEMNNTADGKTLVSYRPVIGFNVDYRVLKLISFLDFNGESTDSFLRFRFTAMPNHFTDNLHGWSYTFGITYGFFARFMSSVE